MEEELLLRFRFEKERGILFVAPLPETEDDFTDFFDAKAEGVVLIVVVIVIVIVFFFVFVDSIRSVFFPLSFLWTNDAKTPKISVPKNATLALF